MGGSFDIRVYDYDDRKKIKQQFEDACSSAKVEDGVSYPGTIAAMYTVNDWRDKRFSTYAEAENFLCNEHNKWDEGMAVSYYLPATAGERSKAKRDKAREKLEATERKQFDVQQAIQQAFVKRKASLVGCKGCGSRLAHHLLVKGLRKGSVSNYPKRYNGRDRNVTFTMPTLPTCPLCKESLLSESDRKRLAVAATKSGKASEAYDVALTPKPSKKVGWVVGGWCSS